MQRKRRFLRTGLALLISSLLSLPVPVFASQESGIYSEIQTVEEWGSLTIVFQDVDLRNAEFAIYKTANMVTNSFGHPAFEETEKFKSYDFNFNEMSESTIERSTAQVKQFISDNKVKPDQKIRLEAGKSQITFEGLSQGLYFVQMLHRSPVSPTVSMTEFLTALPTRDPKDPTLLIWDIQSKAKIRDSKDDQPPKNPPEGSDDGKEDDNNNPNDNISKSSDKSNSSSSTNDRISKSSASRTGTETNMALYIGLAVLALILIVFFICKAKKSKKND